VLKTLDFVTQLFPEGLLATSPLNRVREIFCIHYVLFKKQKNIATEWIKIGNYLCQKMILV